MEKFEHYLKKFSEIYLIFFLKFCLLSYLGINYFESAYNQICPFSFFYWVTLACSLRINLHTHTHTNNSDFFLTLVLPKLSKLGCNEPIIIKIDHFNPVITQKMFGPELFGITEFDCVFLFSQLKHSF